MLSSGYGWLNAYYTFDKNLLFNFFLLNFFNVRTGGFDNLETDKIHFQLKSNWEKKTNLHQTIQAQMIIFTKEN